MVSVIAFLALFASAALAAVPHDFTLHFSGNYSQAGVSTLAASSTQTFVFIGPKVGAVATEQTVHLGSGASLVLKATDGSPPSFQESGNFSIPDGSFFLFKGAGFTQAGPGSLIQAAVNYVVSGGAGLYEGVQGLITANAVLTNDGHIDYFMTARLFLAQ